MDAEYITCFEIVKELFIRMRYNIRFISSEYLNELKIKGRDEKDALLMIDILKNIYLNINEENESSHMLELEPYIKTSEVMCTLREMYFQMGCFSSDKANSKNKINIVGNYFDIRALGEIINALRKIEVSIGVDLEIKDEKWK